MERKRLTHFNENGLFRLPVSPLDAVAAWSREVCLRRPPSRMPHVAAALDRIEGLDRLRGAHTGLLFEASIEPDKHLSAHPALLVRTVRTGEALPFSRLVAASRV